MTRGKHFQSNQRTRIYLDALAEVMGAHGLSALLRLANLTQWIEHPPLTMKRWTLTSATS